MDFVRAAVWGAIAGVVSLVVCGFLAYHIDWDLRIAVFGWIGMAVGIATGIGAGHNRDPVVGALAAAITAVAALGSTMIVAALDGMDTDTQWRSERSFFTYADNLTFWAMMEEREVEWPYGWSYATATHISHLPWEIVEPAQKAWASKSAEELAMHDDFSGVHDVRVLAMRAEEFERAWRERGYEVDPAPGDPDDPQTPPWELFPEEVWKAAMDEWASLSQEQQAERRRRQLGVVEQIRGEEVGLARSRTVFGMLNGAFVIMSMVLAFGCAVGNFDEE
ncbi:MAG: hypothetical protein JJU33_02975 [Phycisphaerales bacterium]|nr:hypothetical protein [Phycisphaerales bacterium]